MLEQRLHKLSLEIPPVSFHSPTETRINGTHWRMKDPLYLRDYGIAELFHVSNPPLPADEIMFAFRESQCEISWKTSGITWHIPVGMDGRRCSCILPDGIPSLLESFGYWKDDSTFILNMRFTESCWFKEWAVSFDDDHVLFTPLSGMPGFPVPEWEMKPAEGQPEP